MSANRPPILPGLPCLAAFVACVLAAALPAAENKPALPAAVRVAVDFRRDIFPILSAHCFACHKGADAPAGLRLDLRSELLGEGDGKPVVRPGDSSRSRLVHAVAGLVPGKVMPRKGPRLTDRQVGLLRAWIDQGLAWDDALLPPSGSAKHWAFQPVSAPTPPAPRDGAWGRNPIDAFIRAAQEARGGCWCGGSSST